MNAVVRTYSGAGAKELFDLLEDNLAEVENSMRSVNGFVGYTLARTDSGGFSVTVCEDAAGIEQSYEVAKEWIAKHPVQTSAAAPQVSDGIVLAHVK